jgi:hypothetical protein
MQTIEIALPGHSSRAHQSLFVHFDLSSVFDVLPKPLEAVWAAMFALRPSSFANAALASRAWSASRVYRSASVSVLWPSAAMISWAVHPASASRRPAALRRPCGWHSSGSPAMVIASRIHWPKPSTVNGLPRCVLNYCKMIALGDSENLKQVAV